MPKSNEEVERLDRLLTGVQRSIADRRAHSCRRESYLVEMLTALGQMRHTDAPGVMSMPVGVRAKLIEDGWRLVDERRPERQIMERLD